ncbi:MAG: hypothetical protein JWM56_200 [Candidatus Peribacteria bacterium]|nr:hypothetical protein [Candidatus Peribacteria bacterium]
MVSLSVHHSLEPKITLPKPEDFSQLKDRLPNLIIAIIHNEFAGLVSDTLVKKDDIQKHFADLIDNVIEFADNHESGPEKFMPVIRKWAKNLEPRCTPQTVEICILGIARILDDNFIQSQPKAEHDTELNDAVRQHMRKITHGKPYGVDPLFAYIQKLLSSD